MIKVDWGQVMTIVIADAIVGILGVVGAQVYKGAVVDKEYQTAIQKVLLEDVAKLSSRIDKLSNKIDGIKYENIFSSVKGEEESYEKSELNSPLIKEEDKDDFGDKYFDMEQRIQQTVPDQFRKADLF